jgi:predicted DNA-binding transcriptional regulator YafY
MSDASPLLRQWKLLAGLAAHDAGRDVHEISREYGVGEKTIRRDLALLRRVGFPIEETPSDHGRKLWRLAASNGPPLAFNWQEAMSLYLACRFLEPLAGTYFWDSANLALAKIRACLTKPALKYLDRMAGAIHLTDAGAGRYSDKAAYLDRLTLAIEECRVALLTYRSERSTEPVTREIHPYAWVFHRQSPYLVAFASEHREVRLYKADRIHDVEVSLLRFPRPIDFDPSIYLAGAFGIFRGSHGKNMSQKVRVKFLPPVVQYVSEKRWHPSQKLAPQNDGTLLAEFHLSATDEIKRWLLSFGRNAEVLEPKSLRREMAAELRDLLKVYESIPEKDEPRSPKRKPR